MYPAKVEKKKQKKKRQGIFHAKDSATLAADAVVRQTIFRVRQKSSAYGVSDLACDTAGLHGYVMHQT